MRCNCSRCQTLGWVMAFAPRAKVTISARRRRDPGLSVQQGAHPPPVLPDLRHRALRLRAGRRNRRWSRSTSIASTASSPARSPRNTSTAARSDRPRMAELIPDAAGAYRVLARKYRPATFDDLIGQEAMVRTLAQRSLGRVASIRPTSSPGCAASARPRPRASSPTAFNYDHSEIDQTSHRHARARDPVARRSKSRAMST